MIIRLSIGSKSSIIINNRHIRISKKVSKGVWGMPRLSEAKKDVISCEKLREVASKL